MNQKVERFYPIVCAIVTSALFYTLQYGLILPDKLIADLVSATLVVSATLIGFFLTITAILNTINTRRMKFIKTGGLYPLLLRYQDSAIWLNVIVVSLSIIYPFVTSLSLVKGYIAYINCGIIFIIIWSWLSSIRFMYIFLKLIRDPE